MFQRALTIERFAAKYLFSLICVTSLLPCLYADEQTETTTPATTVSLPDEPVANPANTEPAPAEAQPAAITSDAQAAPEPPAAEQAAPAIEPEPDAETLNDWLSVIVDNSMGLQNRELPAYRYYINKINHLSYDELKAGAVISPPFKYFHREAQKHRGEKVDIDVNIRRVEKVELTDADKFEVKHLYEIWGWNQESQAWLYVFVTTELPPGFQEGKHVNFHSRFAGYFFKLQGYRAANAAKGNDPLVAPLLIGKFSENIPVPKSKTPFGMGQIFLLIFCLVLVMFFRFTRLASFFGTSSMFPTRIKDDVEKPTDKENLEWIGSNIGTNAEPQNKQSDDIL